jgi:hypothetical protein
MKKLSLVVVVAAFASTALAADPPAPKGDAAKPADKAPAAAPGKPADAAAKPATPAAPAKPDAAVAPAAPANAPPPPSPELAKNLKGMEGKWKCDGTFPASQFGVAHKAKASFEMKSDLNGYFEMARYEEKKSKENPQPYVMQQVIGFDPSKSELVRTDMDGMGAITHLTSKGWDGDKMTWEGDTMAGPQKLKFKETHTKKGDKEVDIAMEMAGPDGNFAPLGDLVCKK